MKKERLTQCPLYIGLTHRVKKLAGNVEEGATLGMCLEEECELFGDERCLIRTAVEKFTEVMGIIGLGVRMYIDSMEKR